MKAVILAGGRGSRLSEETGVRPKPMVEVGDQPILWHIMKIFGEHGVNDFILCCGYRGFVIKEYFATYFLRRSDVTFDLCTNSCEYRVGNAEPWRVTLVDTGEDTMTGGRLKRVESFVGDETFFFTYGDGVADIDLTALLVFHKEQGTAVTMTAVKPPGRFGAIALAADQNQVHRFREKPDGDGAWINGGYFVVEPTAFGYIDDDSTVWEQQPLEQLARDGQLSAYRHASFWHPMDTLRDKEHLEALWQSDPPWKVWN